MITEWFLTMIAGFFGWIADFVPDWNVPVELTDPDGLIGSVFAISTGLGVWIDWAFIGALASIPLIIWVAGITWQGLRMMWSHLPFVGGR